MSDTVTIDENQKTPATILRSNASFLRACYTNLSDDEVFAVAKHLENAAEEYERLRTQLAERDEHIVEYLNLLEQAYQILDGYGNLDTYRAERTGGVLAGCPRGEVPTPDKLVMPARMFCKRLIEAVAAIPTSAKHNAEILRAAEKTMKSPMK